MHEKRFDGEVERLRSPERLSRMEVERVVSLCTQAASLESVLDVGTGSGLFAEAFTRHGLAAAGVDANPQMVEAAGQLVPQVDFREATAEALPYPDASFDLVFMGLVFHETDDPLRALQEARRVACKQVSILEWPYREEQVGPPLAHRMDPLTLEKLAHQAGFTHLETIPLNVLVLYRLFIEDS